MTRSLCALIYWHVLTFCAHVGFPWAADPKLHVVHKAWLSQTSFFEFLHSMSLCNPYFLSINNNICLYNSCRYMKEENICLAVLYEFLFMMM